MCVLKQIAGTMRRKFVLEIWLNGCQWCFANEKSFKRLWALDADREIKCTVPLLPLLLQLIRHPLSCPLLFHPFVGVKYSSKSPVMPPARCQTSTAFYSAGAFYFRGSTTSRRRLLSRFLLSDNNWSTLTWSTHTYVWVRDVYRSLRLPIDT